MRELRALARDPRARADAGATLAEGPRVIDAALDRDASLLGAYLGYGARHAFGALVSRLEADGIPVVDLKEGVLEKIGKVVAAHKKAMKPGEPQLDKRLPAKK